MKTIAAREAKNNFGALIDDARREPVSIERNGRPAVVVISPERYKALLAMENPEWSPAMEQSYVNAKHPRRERAVVENRSLVPRLPDDLNSCRRA
ncbi:MAG TPA: type II toxin-antitoxin system Phd/YefM family antitoxin [Fimbriimonas sp.]|nr:type II toxin-antitoxin system Phd/YefM family antitoxin [Fimbriimonas sp.]